MRFAFMLFALFASLAIFPRGEAATIEEARFIVRNLLDPEKLATLRPRAASDRIDKAMYWLQSSPDPAAVIAQVAGDYGWSGTAKGELLEKQILRNLAALEALGCLTPENLEALRRGRAPRITRGPYAGEIVELDHIVPVAHAPH